jgi:hypothetical protein
MSKPDRNLAMSHLLFLTSGDDSLASAALLSSRLETNLVFASNRLQATGMRSSATPRLSRISWIAKYRW